MWSAYPWTSFALVLHCRPRRSSIVLIALLARGPRANGGLLVVMCGFEGWWMMWSPSGWERGGALVVVETAERAPWCSKGRA